MHKCTFTDMAQNESRFHASHLIGNFFPSNERTIISAVFFGGVINYLDYGRPSCHFTLFPKGNEASPLSIPLIQMPFMEGRSSRIFLMFKLFGYVQHERISYVDEQK